MTINSAGKPKKKSIPVGSVYRHVWFSDFSNSNQTDYHRKTQNGWVRVWIHNGGIHDRGLEQPNIHRSTKDKFARVTKEEMQKLLTTKFMAISPK